MRHRLHYVLLALLLAGCGISREQYLAKTREVQALRQIRDEQAEQIRMLRGELTDLLVAIDDLQARKAIAEARVAQLQDDLNEALAAKVELADLNAQLVARHREVLQLNEQLSTVWYNAALDRARRATGPELNGPEGTPPPSAVQPQ